jgi:hypothetical protein
MDFFFFTISFAFSDFAEIECEILSSSKEIVKKKKSIVMKENSSS